MEIGRVQPGAPQGIQARPAAEAPGQPFPTPGLQEAQPADPHDKATLTQSEEDYFASAFPSAAKEISQHILYQRTGIRQQASLGSVIDRKG